MPDIEIDYNDSDNPPFEIGEKIEALNTVATWKTGDILTVKSIEWSDTDGEWVVTVKNHPNRQFARRFKKLGKPISVLTAKDYRRKGFQLLIDPPKKFTDKEREEIAKVYKFRHKIAEIYRMSPQSGEAIQNIRTKIIAKQASRVTYHICNPRYAITLPYSTPSERRSAIQYYKEKLRYKRQELKEIETELTPYGYCHIQKIHTLPNSILNFYYQKILTKSKYPESKEAHYIGIEIECMIPKNSDLSKFRLYAKKVSLAGDSSIHVDQKNYKSQEIRLLTKVSEYRNDITELCQTLEEMKAKVNDSCGLHVHLDMRGESREIITQRYINLVKSQKFLQGLVNEKRRKNTYCKTTRTLNPYLQRDRYYAINGKSLEKFNTLEIRLHHGSIDAKEIINWVTLLLGIIKEEPIKRTASTIKSFLDKLNISEEVKAYVRSTTLKNTPVTPDTLPTKEETNEDYLINPVIVTCGLYDNYIGCDVIHSDSFSHCSICDLGWRYHSHHRCGDGRMGHFPECDQVLAERQRQTQNMQASTPPVNYTISTVNSVTIRPGVTATSDPLTPPEWRL